MSTFHTFNKTQRKKQKYFRNKVEEGQKQFLRKWFLFLFPELLFHLYDFENGVLFFIFSLPGTKLKVSPQLPYRWEFVD